MRVLVCLIIIAMSTVAHAAQADPLTFYYGPNLSHDPTASFETAAAGLQIGPPYPAYTETENFKYGVVTAGTNGGATITTISTYSITSFFPGGNVLIQIGGDFDSPPGCNPGPLGCVFGPALDSIVISFASPIAGLEGSLSIFEEGPTISLNGECLGPHLTQCGPISYSGFFGAIGTISTLEFFGPGDFTDSPVNFGLTLVPEPSSLILLLSGIFLMSLVIRIGNFFSS